MKRYNFIRTQDAKVADVLKSLGFRMIDDKNNTYTFINNQSLKFSKDFDMSKIYYTNILCI